MRKSLHRQGGFSMIEMLVAIVIFSIGMIGVALMQLRGMSYTKDAGSRTQATVLARAMADRMRATMQESFRGPVLGNVDWMEQVDYRYPGGAVATACSSSCTLQQAANNDVYWISQQVLQKLPPPASGQAVTITRAAAPSQMHTVQLRWAEPDGDQAYDIEVYPM